MATYTTNLNLILPATTDNINVADINNNSETLDGLLKQLPVENGGTGAKTVAGAQANLGITVVLYGTNETPPTGSHANGTLYFQYEE